MQSVSEIGILLLLYIGEHYFTFLPESKNRDQHAFANLALYSSYLLVIYFFYSLCSGLPFTDAGWSNQNPIGLQPIFHGSWWAQTIAAFILLDLWSYLMHRIVHVVPVFWRFHRVHHTDDRMDVTTAVRHHAGEGILALFLFLPLIFVFGITPAQLALYGLCSQPIILFSHSNIALPEKYDRLIRIFFVSPAMHRVHHSPIRYETNSNYAFCFSFWDRLGKTYRRFDRTKPAQYGLDEFNGDGWQNLRGMLKTPFVSQ